MSTYPTALDDDSSIVRIDDNLSELGTEAINQLRAAVFAIETELGILPAGSAGDIAARLNAFSNPDGTVKASAIASIGLVTLPITNIQVGSNAGIKETKLSLDFKTADLHTQIVSNTALLNSLTAFANITSSDLIAHITGAKVLTNGNPAQHILSQILLNKSPSDPRDPAFVWNGLKNKNGIARTALQAMDALNQINTDLINHENSTASAHLAAAVSVDTDNFIQIPVTATDVQQALNYIDEAELLRMSLHRATQHSAGIPKISRSQAVDLPDGYRAAVVPPTPVHTFLIHPPSVNSVDNTTNGDDLVKFIPNNSGFLFDAQFSQVKIGDVVRINYGEGFESSFLVDSFRYTPGVEWVVRINGTNLCEADGYARIDRAPFDYNTEGVLAVAAANATPTGSFNLLSSVIVGDPRGATAFGLGFDPGKLDATHYKLYLEFYPNGNPVDKIISLPFIDVTGNAGATPGSYTLDSVIQATNNAFRNIGYNYRFIAFAYQEQFGIMTDSIGNPSFAIINGQISAGSLSTGIYSQNVIGGNALDDFDALGFGAAAADLASPTYQTSFSDATAAQMPTKLIAPVKNRFYYANGQRRDTFNPTYLANSEGYWDGYISTRNPIGSFTVETTYTINLALAPAGLKPGKTIVVQPTVGYNEMGYSDVDYGRFIIKNLNFIEPCGGAGAMTQITVINSISTTGVGFGFSSGPSLPVKIYFSSDSVDFDIEEVIDLSATTVAYRRIHEIYIDQNGKTFSHERGRMPNQVEDHTPSLLGTSKLHLRSISPKLRGYRDASPTIFNKYIRFYVISYNSVSGEFTGFLGQRVNPTSIIRTGPPAVARKNTPTKFYDETGVDYIELEYVETSTISSFMSTASPRYVDIELFPSLQLDDELLLLGTCEVNWSPDSNQDVVRFVQNTRQFGSVAANDFTDEAVAFISAGDRLLHQNGVIQGFDFDSINTLDNREVYFKGGQAVVNGTIVNANNQSVVIPAIYPSGSSLPQNVVWAICLNEDGELSPIIVTSTKIQFLATPGSGAYYLPSVTFTELILTRKDLLPLYLATAHIASFTLTASDVKDVRKYVRSEGANHDLVWSGDVQTGNFLTFDSLKNYLINFGTTDNTVKIKGNFIFNGTLDLTGFQTNTIFEGAGCTLTTSALRGFLIGSNVTLRNINFIYNAPITSTGIVNSGNGCIYGGPGVNYRDIAIEGCNFTCTQSGARAPFVNFELSTNTFITNLKIRDNNWIDTNTGAFAAVAIINLNSGGSIHPATVQHTDIVNNKGNGSQGIFITSNVSGGNYAAPGMSALNVTIEKNICGAIGFILTGTHSSSVLIDGYTEKNNISVINNECEFIGCSDGASGKVTFSTMGYSTGSAFISGNRTSWIQFYSQNNGTINSVTKIVNNRLSGYTASYGLATYGISVNAAIRSIDGSGGTEIGDILVDGNSINFHNDGSTGYDVGIQCGQSSIITSNVVRGLQTNAIGIYVFTNGVDKHFNIANNDIVRGANTITRFIKVDTMGTTGFISNNRFDDTTVDIGGTDYFVITANLPSGWLVEPNKNQVSTLNVLPTQGIFSITSGGGDVTDPAIRFFDYNTPPTSNILGSAGTSTLQLSYIDTSSIVSFAWTVPLFGIVPPGAIIRTISITHNLAFTTIPSSTRKLYFKISSTAGTDIDTHTISAGDISTGLLTRILGVGGTALSNTYKNTEDAGLYIQVIANINSSSSTLLQWQNLSIAYRY